MAREPSPELLAWLKAEQIRWAHSQKKLELVA
jgi:hypothetical protein